MKTIYVGNLPYTVSEDEVRQLFSQHGNVHAVKLVNDRSTGQPRGFGFVEMPPEHAELAIRALEGIPFQGRTLRVNEARARQPRMHRRPFL